MELIIEKLLGFTMVLTRISAFFLVVPVFSWQSIPTSVKVAMTVLMAIFFSAVSPFNIDTRGVFVLRAILLLANEASYGLALGLVVVIAFNAVKFGGHIVERQMGLTMAQVLDPLTGEEAQPLSSLLEVIFIILFLAANGHHLFLLIISRSYEIFPIGSIPTIAVLTSGVVKAGSTMLMAGLRLAAPMFGAFLVLMVVLAVLARIAPQMNILFISFPLRVGLGLIMAMVFLPFISGFLTEFADLMGELLPL